MSNAASETLDGSLAASAGASRDKGQIIDPNGLDLFRLTMMVITASICGGIFALAGDMAAGGASTGAVLISWAICFVGVFSLMMCFNGLSQARPDLTGGIYAYAAAGFGDFVGFNSAWGYWVSACLSNVSFAILLFSALGYFFHPFESGNNLLSCVCASAFLWLLVWLVSRGVKEAAGINVIVTIAKLVPLSLFVLSIALLGKFDPAIFMENFWGEAGGPDLGTQIVSTMIALVWVFTGIEGAVVISGRAKYARDVGRATVIGFLSVLSLYIIISFLSAGVMTNEELAALGNPPMAGILEHVVGPWGAALVNIAVIISLLGATLGHTIMCTECPYEAAKSGAFCKAFTRTNKNGAPVFAIVLTSIIAQVFLVLLYFNESTYQVFYFFATGMIMVPYFLSAMYFCKVALKQENGLIKGIGIFNAVYAVWMVFAAGISVMLATVLLYVPGIFVYAKGQKEKGLKVFETKVDKAVFVALLALLVICIYFVGTGRINPLG